jgi:hypothetical protein
MRAAALGLRDNGFERLPLRKVPLRKALGEKKLRTMLSVSDTASRRNLCHS